METKPELPAVEFAQRTDPGRDPDKQVNEDAWAHEETAFGHLCVLCDGMGGHQNGREAALLAVSAIVETFSKPLASGSGSGQDAGSRGRELLREAIVAANLRVCDLGGMSKQSRPGSTVVALLMHAEGVEVAHVGDSRCYMLQSGQIFQLTKDHTVVQKMVDAQLLTPAQAAVHPDANQILRALGTTPEVEVEVRAQTIPLVPGEAFILCSDGLSDLVDAQEVLRIATAVPPAQAVQQLVDLANARGGHDNITVMILRAARDSAAVSTRVPAPTLAQTLFEAPAMPMLAPPAMPAPSAPAGPVPSAAPSGGLLPAISLPVPAPPPPRARPVSIAVLLGILLGVVGFGAAGFAIFLLLDPNRDAKQVAPFALTGAPLIVNPPPSVALVPVAPEAVPSVDAGPPPAPLPSLVPPRSLRRGHGS
jgi:serine/threonine protein phosphatase PrpC